MTVHLIYPVDVNKKTSPWYEGNVMRNYLKNFYTVECYNWLSFGKINPKSGDILIGHAHPNPYTIFRRSMKDKEWSKVILFQPYNEDIYQLGYLYDVLPFCDHYLTLCGNYWFDRIDKSIFSHWKSKMFHLDLSIDTNLFPYIKKNFNKKNNRKFLYIGNDYAFNNFAKNFSYLKEIINNFGTKYFATAGNRKIEDVKHYGWINILKAETLSNIENYDFLILASHHDANPAVILEAMLLGLIPIITKQSGYDKEKDFFYIPLNDLKGTLKVLNFVQNIDSNKLEAMSLNNLSRVKDYYSDKRFTTTVQKVLNSKILNSKIELTHADTKKFKQATKSSPNYYLGPKNVLSIIKANLAIIFRSFFC